MRLAHLALLYAGLSLGCFSAILAWAVLSSQQTQQDINRYFNAPNNLMEQQLATRARSFLQSATRQLLAANPNADGLAWSQSQIDIAYAFLDIGLYRERYQCVSPSLRSLSHISKRFARAGERPDSNQLRSIAAQLTSAIECTTIIEKGQWQRRKASVLNMIAQNDRTRTRFAWGASALYALGLAFGVLAWRTRHAVLQPPDQFSIPEDPPVQP